MEDIQLTIPGKPRYLYLARALVELYAAGAGFSEREVKRIALAVDETCTNLIKHCFQGDPSRVIRLGVAVDEEKMCVRFYSCDAQSDPVHWRPRDLHELRPGGLGTHIIRVVMDEIDFRPNGDSFILSLVKYRHAEGERT